MAKRTPKSKDQKKSYYERKAELLSPYFDQLYDTSTTVNQAAPSLNSDTMQEMVNLIRKQQLTSIIQPQIMANFSYGSSSMGIMGSYGNGSPTPPISRIKPGNIYVVKPEEIYHCGTGRQIFQNHSNNFQKGFRVLPRGLQPHQDRQGNMTNKLIDYTIIDDNNNQAGSCSGCYFESELILDNVSTAQTPAKEIDTTQLDRVILKADVKEEIIAVLHHHKHGATIFDEWGLKDVIEYGRGMTFLFHGKPGTGKTWAANCMAKAMGVDLLTIGAAEIQTSEPGGANRNIQNAFKAATDKKSVLFLDECDSLITNRTHVGMIIGSEINTLLTELEKFEGVCILATNRIASLDEALARRISLIVEFPAPTQVERAAIWTKMLPKKMPLHKDVSIEDLSTFNLTGGQIKNAVLQAARLAVSAGGKKVEKKHFEKAIERIQSSHDLFGKEDHYIQIASQDKLRTSAS